jgi:O-antigen/teichoic acid export membrane protein
LSKYAAFSLIGALSFVFYNNFGKIMISRDLNITDLGIYNAYFSASVNLMGIFSGMFYIVFFPTVSKYENKGIIFKRINKFIPYLVCLGIPLIFIFEFIVLKLYGNEYPLNAVWMILFPIASVCIVIDGLYGWLLNSVGSRGAKIVSFAAVILVFVNVGLNLILIPRIGITGSLISMIISYTSSAAVILYFGKKYLST